MPTLRQLNYLVTLADSPSFVHAARVANVSQPTLSQQVRALEERLGVTLLDRGASGAILTPVGRSVVARARRILSEVREIEALAARASDPFTGTFRLGTTPTLGPYLLSPIIADLHRIAPDLRLYVREGIPEQQSFELSRGELDVHLGPLPITGDDLEIEALFREPLHLVTAIDGELASGGVIKPERLTGQSVLSLDRRHHLHRQTAALAASYRMTLAPDYEGTSLDSLHQMAASGLGLTVLPALYLASDVGGRTGLAVLEVEGWNAHRSVALAWRRGSSMAETFRLIAAQIQNRAREILGRREPS
jgi:LysR family hydrogen peroxide-inducible transcriptional activator